MGDNDFVKIPSLKYYKNLNKDIHYAEACVEIHFLLKYKNPKYDNEKWKQVLSNSKVFWTVTRKSLLEASILNLKGICDAYHKTIKFIDSQNDYFNNDGKTKQYQICREKMVKGVKLLESIDMIRDKTIAHFDPEYFESVNDLYQEQNLNIVDIRKLIVLLKEISDDLIKIIFDCTYDYYELNNYSDIKDLMIKCLD